ncbi:MAG: hypothetical protein HY670_02225, partial [Chloroflexi bacterium]|nr:hypothetical protein [Chloroflexota bacterium]
MKMKLLLATLLAVALLVAAAIAVTAQDEVPPPYAGLKNPFPWDDAAAQ